MQFEDYDLGKAIKQSKDNNEKWEETLLLVLCLVAKISVICVTDPSK